MSNAPSLVYAAVDWFSLTTGDGPEAQAAYDRARALAIEQQDAGDELRSWGSHGYRGFGLPHVRCGERQGDVLVELSGELAARHWLAFYPLARNVTRLDSCVDVQHDPPQRDLALRAYESEGKPLVPGHPPVEKSIVINTAGGQTCYLGAPASARRGRLYDKHHQSPDTHPAGTWRYEVQERGSFGRITADVLAASPDADGDIRSIVHAYFNNRGVLPWFQADDRTVPLPRRPARRDAAAYVNWLHGQVAPGVHRWSRRGYRDAIVQALGLGDRDLIT